MKNLLVAVLAATALSFATAPASAGKLEAGSSAETKTGPKLEPSRAQIQACFDKAGWVLGRHYKFVAADGKKGKGKARFPDQLLDNPKHRAVIDRCVKPS